jgi:hypothetical protein
MATMTVLDGAGVSTTVEKPLAPGRAASTASRPVVLSNEDAAYLDGIEGSLTSIDTRLATQAGYLDGVEAKLDAILLGIGGNEYETVAASQTTQALGATGATGDYLGGVLIIPATTSPGAVAIKDGAGSAVTIFAGGASSVTSLVPFFVPLGIKSGVGAWQITTGANVSAIGVGDFT